MARQRQRLGPVHIPARFWLVFALVALLSLALGLNTRPALAHGEATLVVNPAVAAPGGAIEVTAEGVDAGEEFTLTLEGINVQTTLGTVTVGDDEVFRQEFTVPAETPPGSYQVAATSGEGERLTAELTVEAGATEQAAPAEPSAELMQLDRSKPIGELAVIVAGLAVSAGLGLALVWRREK